MPELAHAVLLVAENIGGRGTGLERSVLLTEGAKQDRYIEACNSMQFETH